MQYMPCGAWMVLERLRLVLVETEGPVNLGMIARLADNFDVDELYLVNPKASVEEAKKYAVKAAYRLDEAVIVESLDKALRGSSLSICTSAKTSGRNILREPVLVWEAASLAVGTSGTVALVMGRESVGLTRSEIGLCDLLAYIPASKKYPVLNLANATAVFLYEIFKQKITRGGEEMVEALSPKSKTITLLEAYASSLAEVLVHDPLKREEVVRAVHRIAVKNLSRRREVEMILYLLSKACRRIEGCEDKVSSYMQSRTRGYHG